MWACIAVSCLVAVFIIRGGRCKKIAKELLGKNFKEILCSDRYSAYQWVSNDSRQICWAHLERDFRKISERTGSSSIIGAELLTQTNTLYMERIMTVVATCKLQGRNTLDYLRCT
jgi:hypothetical protein